MHGWRGTLDDEPKQGDGPWDALVDEVHKASDSRVILSHEYFAELPDDRVRKFVADLDRPVHVVFTLRNQAALLSSSWQQTLKGGQRRTFPAWLRESLGEGSSKGRLGRLWRRLQLADLVEKWAEVVGPENITIVVVDKSDRQRLYRTFEQLLDLPEGLLPEDGDGQTSNRSMSAVEAAFFRRVNESMAETDERSRDLFIKLYRRGAINRVLAERTPAADEARLLPPQWAVDRVVKLTQRQVERIRKLPVNVVGVLDVLSTPVSADPHDEPAEVTEVPIDLAAMVTSGMLEAAYGVEKERQETSRARKVKKALKSVKPAAVRPTDSVSRLKGAMGRKPR